MLFIFYNFILEVGIVAGIDEEIAANGKVDIE